MASSYTNSFTLSKFLEFAALTYFFMNTFKESKLIFFLKFGRNRTLINSTYL